MKAGIVRLTIAFVAGAVAGRLVNHAFKNNHGVVRSVAKKVIKTGAAAKSNVKSFAAGLREDFEDVTAEAMTELGHQRSASGGDGSGTSGGVKVTR